MVGESLAIIAVLLVMAAMFARSGRRIFSLFTLPLCSIPLFHLIGWMLRLESLAIMDLVGMAIGVLLCVAFSRSFVSRRSRLGYLVFCCGFMVALVAAYLLNLR